MVYIKVIMPIPNIYWTHWTWRLCFFLHKNTYSVSLCHFAKSFSSFQYSQQYYATVINVVSSRYKESDQSLNRSLLWISSVFLLFYFSKCSQISNGTKCIRLHGFCVCVWKYIGNFIINDVKDIDIERTKCDVMSFWYANGDAILPRLYRRLFAYTFLLMLS